MPMHMLVNTHNAESCAFRSEENQAALEGGARGIEGIAREHGANVHGVWVNRAAHKFFVLVEADNAHVVDDIVVASGWISHTDSEVYSVTTMQSAIESVESQR